MYYEKAGVSMIFAVDESAEALKAHGGKTLKQLGKMLRILRKLGL